jgi:hypothetical protein
LTPAAQLQVNLADIDNVYQHWGEHVTATSYYQRAIPEHMKHPTSIERWKYKIRLAYVKLRESIEHTS